MKRIYLTQSQTAYVDDEDYDWLSRWLWLFDGKYAARKCIGNNRLKIFMHVEIMKRYNLFESEEIDHKDLNKLNNQKENLRPATHAQNSCNRRVQSNNASGFKGVSFDKWANKWIANICHNQKDIKLGRFETLEEAARAYDKWAKIYFGEFARLNFPE